MTRPDHLPPPRWRDHVAHWLFAAGVVAVLYCALRYGPAQ